MWLRIAPTLLLLSATPALGQVADPLDGITVRQSDCRLLQRHVPAADIAHRPGQDAKGRAVAPADVQDGRPNLVPPTVGFDLAVNPTDYGLRNKAQADKAKALDRLAAGDAAAQADLQKAEAKLARSESKGLGATTMSVGAIAYDINTGTLTLDGQPMTSAQEQTVSDACRRQGYLK